MEITNFIKKESSLTVIITKFGMASKILKNSKKEGVTGGTILLGRGIIQNKINKLLGIDELKKEIILMVMDKKIENKIHNFIVEKYKFHNKNTGILFSINLEKIRGVKLNRESEKVEKKEERIMIENEKNNSNIDENNYEAIFVIVNRGDAKEVIKVATENGATGGTILNGRGSGLYENSSIFSMVIEPEKEIILLLVKKEKIDKILLVIEKTMEIEKEGRGIIFTLPINKAIGLYRGE